MSVLSSENQIETNRSQNVELPEEWEIARLEEITTATQYGWTTSADKDNNELKLLRTTDISKGSIDWSSVPGCKKKPDNLTKYLLSPGDIVVSRAGSVGLSYVVKECPQSIFASYLIRFRALPPIESDFIGLYLKSPQYWSAIADETAGIAIPNVNASKLKKLEISLPPLAEQKRIVAKVEELLARVNAARERLAKVKEILKRFRQAVLAAACSGRLTSDWRDNQTNITPVEVSIQEILRLREKQWKLENTPDKLYRPPKSLKTDNFPAVPDSWRYVSSDALFSFVTSGSRGWAKYYAESGFTFIRIGNLDHDTIALDLSQIKHVNPPIGAERQRTRVQVGDILISITADVGMVALVPDGIGEAYVNQHVAISRPVEGVYRPFLAWTLSAQEGGQAQFQNLKRGATKIGLGLDDIRSIAIPFPPIEEQREIVGCVEILFKLADAIEKRVEMAKMQADKMTPAILAKAFHGELVPTEAELAQREGRSYEPASALLSKIKAQK